LASVEALLNLPSQARAWEVFAVRYVFSAAETLPVTSQIVARGEDKDGLFNLHRLDAPRPLARVVYGVWIEADEAQARGILSEPAFDAARTVILPAAPGIALPAAVPAEAPRVQITVFAPERVVVEVRTAVPGLLQLAVPYYAGWEAVLRRADGTADEALPIARADTAFMAVEVPAGASAVEFRFVSRSFNLGAAISLVSLAVLGLGMLGAAFGLANGRRVKATRRDEPPAA
jgi:hypothetical protein